MRPQFLQAKAQPLHQPVGASSCKDAERRLRELLADTKVRAGQLIASLLPIRGLSLHPLSTRALLLSDYLSHACCTGNALRHAQQQAASSSAAQTSGWTCPHSLPRRHCEASKGRDAAGTVDRHPGRARRPAGAGGRPAGAFSWEPACHVCRFRVCTAEGIAGAAMLSILLSTVAGAHTALLQSHEPDCVHTTC